MLDPFWVIVLMAFAYELVDSWLGQGYGTLGSPTLILLGLSAKLVVPAMLFSQVLGDFSSAYFANRYGNVDFKGVFTADTKRAYVIMASGILGVIIASYVGAKLISKEMMTNYVGLVVTAMGVLLLSGIVLKFTWKKLCFLGSLSAFNKGMSGGGYGPVVAGGQTVIGVGAKNSIGITDLAEGPICIMGFLTWTFLNGVPAGEMELLLPLCIGATIAPVLGCWFTKKMTTRGVKRLMGGVILVLGLLTLAKVLNP